MFDKIEGKSIFKYGIESYDDARIFAKTCLLFKLDDEDEQVDSILTSCYNCRYRRWTQKSFECLKM